MKESKLSEADPLTRWVEFFASPHGLEGENLEAKLAQVLEQLEPPADVHDKRLVTLWILYVSCPTLVLPCLGGLGVVRRHHCCSG